MSNKDRRTYRGYATSEQLGIKPVIGDPLPRVEYTVELFEEFIDQGHNININEVFTFGLRLLLKAHERQDES